MLTNLTVTDAKLTDLPFIVDVYNQTIPSRMVTADIEPISVESRINWFNAHNPVTRPIWLIKAEHVKCGWISLSSFYGRPAYDHTVEVSIYIDPNFRGKKIGQWAIQHIEQHAENHGIETLLSYIFGHNKPSLALFEKMEYQQWGYLPNVAQLDDIKRDLVILGKRIKPVYL